MRSKYIDEKYRPYFIFGKSKNGVDVNDGVQDICTVTHKEAQRLISDREELLTLLHVINLLYPKEFDECFYSIK